MMGPLLQWPHEHRQPPHRPCPWPSQTSTRCARPFGPNGSRPAGRNPMKRRHGIWAARTEIWRPITVHIESLIAHRVPMQIGCACARTLRQEGVLNQFGHFFHYGRLVTHPTFISSLVAKYIRVNRRRSRVKSVRSSSSFMQITHSFQNSSQTRTVGAHQTQTGHDPIVSSFVQVSAHLLMHCVNFNDLMVNQTANQATLTIH